MASPVTSVARSAWRGQGIADGERLIPEETAVAFTYNGGSYAVMMATPQDLEDFAFGFSLTEGIVLSPDDVSLLEIVEGDIGIELRMWLSEPCGQVYAERRRHLAGPTGCGLCGIETLAEAVRAPRQVSAGRIFTPADILRAMQTLAPRQQLNQQTRAVHAAAFWTPEEGLVCLREDVGRHNAVDKLAGALVRDGVPCQTGIGLLTSRVSIEMVQKAAAVGIPVLVAVSAPTALAVRTAEGAGITLVAVARSDGFEIFTHPKRIVRDTAAHVA
jgi:FdhD protein